MGRGLAALALVAGLAMGCTSAPIDVQYTDREAEYQQKKREITKKLTTGNLFTYPKVGGWNVAELNQRFCEGLSQINQLDQSDREEFMVIARERAREVIATIPPHLSEAGIPIIEDLAYRVVDNQEFLREAFRTYSGLPKSDELTTMLRPLRERGDNYDSVVRVLLKALKSTEKNDGFFKECYESIDADYVARDRLDAYYLKRDLLKKIQDRNIVRNIVGTWCEANLR